jgi:molybdopterin-binding protein
MARRDRPRHLRIGQAAELLDVTVETVRRWESEGRLVLQRTPGGQRMVRLADIRRLLAERRPRRRHGPPQSARNRFAGVVSRVERDRLTAIVEVLAGPHRIVSLMTREAIDELGLREGDPAVCVVKATQVIVEAGG